MLGLALILVGVSIVLLPMLGRYVNVSSLPSWLIYVYHTDGFYFATSPLLLALSALVLVIYILRR